MSDQFSSRAWLLRPEDWLHWMRGAALPSNDPWNRTPAAGSTVPVASNGGILGNLAVSSNKSPSSGGLLGNALPAIDASTVLPTARPAGGWGPNSPFWLQTVTPLGLTGGIPVTASPPINQDPFERAAARTIRSVRPEDGRQAGAATRMLETYVPHMAQGLADLIALPGRKPAPMPKGLQVNDAGEWLINGRPAGETADGRGWLEDQQRRMDWGPAMALLLALARVPTSRPSATHTAAPSSAPEALQRPRRVPARSPTPGRLFDNSRLHETPDVPQFDLDRYVPPRGVPERIRALANPANIERVNEAVRRGAERGGREFYNTEPLREWSIAEFGPEKGQAAYDEFFDLVGATSMGSRLEDNVRNAAYHYMRSQQGFPPPVPYWDGKAWRLAEPPPPPWRHYLQGLHAKKVGEVLARGSLSPLNNQKSASFVQNLRGNQRPVTIDRHNARLLGVKGAHGRPVDAPPKEGYGFLERLQQEEAAKLGMTPAQYQASAWIGGAEQTGVRSSQSPFLDTFTARVVLTAKKLGLKPEEVLRRFLRGEIPLWSFGGAATAGMSPGGEADE